MESLDVESVQRKINAGIDLISTVHDTALRYIANAHAACESRGADWKPKYRMLISPHTNSLGALFGPAILHINRSSIAALCDNNAKDELCKEIMLHSDNSLSNFKPICHSMTLGKGEHSPVEVSVLKVKGTKVLNPKHCNEGKTTDVDCISEETKTITVKKCDRIILKSNATVAWGSKKRDKDGNKEGSLVSYNTQARVQRTKISNAVNSMLLAQKNQGQEYMNMSIDSGSVGGTDDSQYCNVGQDESANIIIDSKIDKKDQDDNLGFSKIEQSRITQEEARMIESEISVCPEYYFSTESDSTLFNKSIDGRLKEFVRLLFSTTGHAVIRQVNQVFTLKEMFTFLKNYGLLEGKLPHTLFKMQQVFAKGETVHTSNLQSIADLAGSYYTNALITMMPNVHTVFKSERLVIPRVYQLSAQYTTSKRSKDYWKPSIKIPADCCAPLNNQYFLGIIRSEYLSYVRGGVRLCDTNYTRNDMKTLTNSDLKLFDQSKEPRKSDIFIPSPIENKDKAASLSMVILNMSDFLPIYKGGPTEDFKTYHTLEEEIQLALYKSDMDAIIKAFKAYWKSFPNENIEDIVDELVEYYTPENILIIPDIIRGCKGKEPHNNYNDDSLKKRKAVEEPEPFSETEQEYKRMKLDL